jgi:hypothetical protein
MIWASSKSMHMLTTSQLQTYKIDCDKFKPTAASYKKKDVADFCEYLNDFVKPFEIKLKIRSIRIKFDVKMTLEER